MSTPTAVIGTAAPRVDGVRKVTGQATYGADVNLPGMLWCKLSRSTMPHARLVRVDAGRARQMPGVHAVITAEDIPDRLWGRALEDMPVLARGKVRFIGEPIAAVAAEDPDLATGSLPQEANQGLAALLFVGRGHRRAQLVRPAEGGRRRRWLGRFDAHRGAILQSRPARRPGRWPPQNSGL